MNDSTHTDRQPAANQPANQPANHRQPANLPENPPRIYPLHPPPTGASGGLAPYAAPAIIFRTPLEAVAASCYSAPGKADLISCLVGNS